MSNAYYFRRRLGRAASPPTWACYEQIPYGSHGSDEDSYSSSSSCPSSDEHDSDEDKDEEELDMDMEPAEEKGKAKEDAVEGKGKQRAVEEGKRGRGRERHHHHHHGHHRRQEQNRERMYTLRPILTIQRSQGFVWNQDLFVPPYIKDRYVASTSPPNSRCFIPSTSASSTNSALTDYEVEVVEIRVREGELRDIIP